MPGYCFVCGVFVELDALDKRRRAVANANDGDAYFFACHVLYLLLLVLKTVFDFYDKSYCDTDP